MKLPKPLKTLIKNISELKRVGWIYLLTTAVLATATVYIYVVYPYLPSQIPFFYTFPWGERQLALSTYVWGIPLIAVGFTLLNLALSIYEQSRENFLIVKFYAVANLIVTTLLCAYAARIIFIISMVRVEMPVWVKLIAIPIAAAFLATLITVPLTIRLAKRFNFMDDPLRHKHPGMLLSKPTPRAGGLAYLIGILLPALILLPITSSQRLIGIFFGAALCVGIGLRDDQKDVDPYFRLLLQGGAILIAVLSGIILIYIPNPFGEAIKLDAFRYQFEFWGHHSIYYYSVLAAGLWIGWTMNFMSWANGSDGVYAGLVTVASLVIAILMYPSLQGDPQLALFIKLAALSAGAGLGMAIFTWPPQKILWGFGATSAGLIIATLSILGSTKVATTLIVLIIPFLDGVFAVIRRIRRRQAPFWGDREHLHHKLLEGLGWSKQQVAAFYWITTIILGIIGIATSGQSRALSLAMVSGFVIFGIALLNFLKRPPQTKT